MRLISILALTRSETSAAVGCDKERRGKKEEKKIKKKRLDE
jgi:hypothetical protein